MTPNEFKSHPVRSACALALAAIIGHNRSSKSLVDEYAASQVQNTETAAPAADTPASETPAKK